MRTLRSGSIRRHSPLQLIEEVQQNGGVERSGFLSILGRKNDEALTIGRQIERSISERDGVIEIRTAEIAAETNSETQPWVMMGLLGHPYD